MVEDPEQAVFNIRQHGDDRRIGRRLTLRQKPIWDSAEALKDFQQSPICGEFLRSLGFDDNEASRGPLLVSFQWDCGFCMGDKIEFLDDLWGRITLIKLHIPYDAGAAADREAFRDTLRNAYNDTFGGWMPPGCKDLAGPPAIQFHAYAYVDDDDDDGPGQQEEATDSRRVTVCYVFFRWNVNGASSEREEASFREPGAHEIWAGRVAMAMPPVETWEQERWDIEVAPPVVVSDTKEGDQDGSEESGEESDEESDQELVS
ncbi:hypothetical protein B0T22DRAFT_440681 [Podospora appendiculata]|uniref:Uncharacterized protein n=1 Tax=Podospora appendiculata TaxID=314037 RepID=A0AAE0XBI4_9PEZI|nr:hypothetical protein B0T22DRAFT_440681 [Podospora appendiculata]